MPKYDKIELYGDVHGNSEKTNDKGHFVPKVLTKGTVVTPDELKKIGMTEEGIKEAIKVGAMGVPIKKKDDGEPEEEEIELVFQSGSPSENAEAAGEVESKASQKASESEKKESVTPPAKQMDRAERVSGTR